MLPDVRQAKWRAYSEIAKFRLAAGQHAKVHMMSYGAAAAAMSNEGFGQESPGRAPARPVSFVSVRTGAGELAVEVAGRGNPVVLVQGWGVDRRMWAHEAAAF